ncbi:integral membrane protein [Sorangium cellulosum]|uniref:Integral membrane protein n=1 Tax=Sorangium cellulosum TaxID=56 RepID=A0A4P2PVT2_SORCE|nr:oligosaccharide flippase family protein [Sorangium cellulosum]AUX20618.1 integral membrane protein [Sorangium cellulosum]
MQRTAVPLPPQPPDAPASPAASAPVDPSQPSPAPSPPTPAPSPAGPTAARSAGRGGLAIAFAKVSFIVFGFIQQLILPRLLGVDGYGEVSVVLAGVGVVNNVIVATGIQGVSRAVSSVAERDVAEAFRRTLALHAVLAVVVSAGFALLAGSIASFSAAPHIATPLRLAAAIVLLYGLYAPLVGALNGQRRFLAQAGFDIAYGALRTASIAAGAILFLRAGQSGVLGAIAGFVAAAGIIVPLALSRTGLGRRGSAGPTPREHLVFLLPLAVSQTFLNFLLQTDFFLLRRFLGQATDALALGQKAADDLIGVYRGAQLFAFLPYQLLFSITFILFPMLARAHAEGDRAAVRRYTMTGVRLSFLLTGLLVAPISGLAPHVLRFAFPVEIWSRGGGALRVLSLGMGAFAVLGVASAALTSLRRERIAAALTASTVALVALGCSLAVPRAPFGTDMLVSSAVATSLALATAALVAGALLHRVAGGFVAARTALRVLAAMAAAIALGAQLPWLGKIAVLGEALLVGLVYIALLVATRELGRDDLATLRQAFGRSRRPA